MPTEIRLDKAYLLFPIREDAVARRMRLVRDGNVVASFMAKLGLPADWWAHLDVGKWRDEVVTVVADNQHLEQAVRTSSHIWSPETLYREALRPAFHFTSKRGWINDPNGLVYHDRRYHLFFQHNPYGLEWGNIHWGHAISPDLIHWTELPIALFPTTEADMPFSGSAVVDWPDSSGWARDGMPAMVIAYTSTGRGECIAYSQDSGMTWTEWAGNPVVQHRGRDPRLIWHRESRQWVMLVYDERPSTEAAGGLGRGLAFYTSTDFRTWQETSWLSGFYECPDLFELAVDGDPARTKWILTAAPGDYYIGEFDGVRFRPESRRLPGPSGQWGRSRIFYAAQTFSNHPYGDVVQIAWGRVHTERSPFTQLMLTPTTLALRTTADGLRLCRQPVESLNSLRIETKSLRSVTLGPSPLLTELVGDAWDIEATLRPGITARINLNWGADNYSYDPPTQLLIGPQGALAIPNVDGLVRMRVLIDRTTIEVFGDQGQAYGIFTRSDPGPTARLAVHTSEPVSDVGFELLNVHALKSAWVPPLV